MVIPTLRYQDAKGAIDCLERAWAAGADISRGLTDMDYGSREFSARDSEGNVWTFGTYDPFRGT